MSWHVPLLLFTHPSSLLGHWPLILPLEPTLRPSGAALPFSQIPPLPFCLSLSLSLSLLSPSHTATRLPPTNPHPSHHKKAEAPLCSLHLLLAFGANNADTAPTVIAPHVPHGPTCFVSSPTTSSYKNFYTSWDGNLVCQHLIHTRRHARTHVFF